MCVSNVARIFVVVKSCDHGGDNLWPKLAIYFCFMVLHQRKLFIYVNWDVIDYFFAEPAS